MIGFFRDIPSDTWPMRVSKLLLIVLAVWSGTTIAPVYREALSVRDALLALPDDNSGGSKRDSAVAVINTRKIKLEDLLKDEVVQSADAPKGIAVEYTRLLHIVGNMSMEFDFVVTAESGWREVVFGPGNIDE